MIQDVVKRSPSDRGPAYHNVFVVFLYITIFGEARMKVLISLKLYEQCVITFVILYS